MFWSSCNGIGYNKESGHGENRDFCGATMEIWERNGRKKKSDKADTEEEEKLSGREEKKAEREKAERGRRKTDTERRKESGEKRENAVKQKKKRVTEFVKKLRQKDGQKHGQSIKCQTSLSNQPRKILYYF